MRRLADYEYYITGYGGTILERSEFNALAARASAQVIAYTFGRAAESELDEVKDAVCAVCDILHKEESGGNIKSENNDGYSVTYGEKEKTLDEEIRSAVLTCLQHTGLTRRTL